MLKRLTNWQILGISAAIWVVLFLIMYFALISPTQSKTADIEKATKAAQDAGGTQQEVNKKQSEKKAEQKKADKAMSDWRIYSATYMPELQFDPKANLIATYQRDGVRSGNASYGVKDFPTLWGRWVESWYDAQRANGIMRDNPVFAIDAYPTDPNKISMLTSIALPAQGKPWSVSVTAKSFAEAMAHLKRFNGMTKHGVPVINNVVLDGHSPNLKLTYDLMLYIIPGKEPPKEDPRIAGGTGSGGGGGFGGRMGGGMSGGPGGGQAAMMSMMMGGGGGGAATSGGKGGKGAASAD